MRHEHRLPAYANPHIAVSVGPGRMNQAHVGTDGREMHNRVVIAKRVAGNKPIVPARQDVAAYKPPQRHKGNAFFTCLQSRVNGRACAVPHNDFSFFYGVGKARRKSLLAERNARAFHFSHATRANQQLSLKAKLRNGEQAQVPRPAPHQRTDAGHGAGRVFRRQGEQRAVGDLRGDVFS